MSKKRHRQRCGASLESRHGLLRLRFRWRTPDGKPRQFSRATALADTPEHRHELAKLSNLIGALIRANKDPLKYLDEILRPADDLSPKPLGSAIGLTVGGYFETWIADKVPPEVRRAQARDYRRHIMNYVLPKLGDLPLSKISARDILGLRAELRQRGLSLKFAKNILQGSFKAMIRDAREIDQLIDHDPFVGVRWERIPVPGPDPFSADERHRIIEWFRNKRFSFNAGRASEGPRVRPHPHYFAFVHTLFWTGMRPSEAAGLRWGDVDLDHGVLRVVRSRHLFEDSAPKTGQAARTVELLPETVRILSSLQPVRVTPDAPVFVNTLAKPIEPNSLLPHWYACQRVLGIRVRGLYGMKDSYVSTVLPLKPIPWIEAQTGVAYPTLKRHYGKWLRQSELDEAIQQLDRVAAAQGDLVPSIDAPREQTRKSVDNSAMKKCERGDLNPHGCYPTGS